MAPMTHFHKFPFRFDVERLKQEATQFSAEEWFSHPIEIAGDSSVILISVGGTLNDDFAISGPMAPTSLLERCPYLKQILQAFAIPLSRCRLIKFSDATAIETPPYADCYYHWFRRTPIYIPIVTHPTVQFWFNEKPIHLEAGEAWLFKNIQGCQMTNDSEEDCIHLVIETKASQTLEEKLTPQQFLDLNTSNQLFLEPYTFEVLTPQEIRQLMKIICSEITEVQMFKDELLAQDIEGFQQKWEEVFSQFGHHNTGELAYQELILHFNEHITSRVKKCLLPSGKGQCAMEVINSMLLTSSRPVPRRLSRQLLTRRNPKTQFRIEKEAWYRVSEKVKFEKKQDKYVKIILDLFTPGSTIEEVLDRVPSELTMTQDELTHGINELVKIEWLKEDFLCPQFDRPIFIVSAPRAGSTLLFETLSQFPGIWTIGEESHEIIEGIPELHPVSKGYISNRLTEQDVFPQISFTLKERFTQQLQDREQRSYLSLPAKQRPLQIRFLEKTPKNALRIPFLKTVFPQALFIYLYRDPKENISSLVEGWRSRRFIAYKKLPGWPYREWSFLLPPGWSSLKKSSLVEISAYQWKVANSCILEDLSSLPKSSWHVVHYSKFLQEPKKILHEISQFAGLEWDSHIEQYLSRGLPISRMTLSSPAQDKWRKNEQEIAAILSTLEPFIHEVIDTTDTQNNP